MKKNTCKKYQFYQNMFLEVHVCEQVPTWTCIEWQRTNLVVCVRDQVSHLISTNMRPHVNVLGNNNVISTVSTKTALHVVIMDQVQCYSSFNEQYLQQKQIQRRHIGSIRGKWRRVKCDVKYDVTLSSRHTVRVGCADILLDGFWYTRIFYWTAL